MSRSILFIILLLPSIVLADDYISPRETSDRIVKLETRVDLKFEELEKNISLAKQNLDYRLQGMNEFQKRMDKLEGTFATKEEVQSNSRLIYIGIGILFAFQIAIQVVGMRKYSKEK